jgi:N-acetylmuramoyl-L-alanine amidase
LVVIDPGHGGQDPGALSPNNTLEKDITLAVAKALRDAITASGDIDVKLTREDDKFVSLEDRSAFARANKADLFIAIHADTVHGTSVSGPTIYTLSDKGSDEEAEALAQKENRADEVAGIALTSQKEDIANLLINLAQRDSRNQAGLFARSLLANLRDVTRMTGKPVRSAGFTVLKSPDVPSLLVELGYLSNAADEERMKSPAWQKLMARSMAMAVQRFLVPAAVVQR